jgi:hypothetical protein
MKILVYAIAVPFLAGVALVVFYAAIILLSVCAVTVVNTGGSTVEVSVFAETQYVGAARLAPGERLTRIFMAGVEGAMKVSCRKDGASKSVTQDFDYVTGGMPSYYSMTVSGCAMAREHPVRFL